MEEEKKTVCVQGKFNEGDMLVQPENRTDRMVVVMSGTVEAAYKKMRVTLKPGAVLNLEMAAGGECGIDCMALEEVITSSFDYNSPGDFSTFFEQDERCRTHVMDGCLEQTKHLYELYETGCGLLQEICDFAQEKYKDYKGLCAKAGCEARNNTPLIHAGEIAGCLEGSGENLEYFRAWMALPPEVRDEFLERSDAFRIHHIELYANVYRQLFKSCITCASRIEEKLGLLCSEENVNLLMMYMELIKGGKMPHDMINELLRDMQDIVRRYERGIRHMKEKLGIETQLSVRRFQLLCDNVSDYYRSARDDEENADALDITQNMLDKLLEYSRLDEDFCDQFRMELKEFVNMPDKSSTEDTARALRKRLTNMFYKLYQRVFFRAEDENRYNAVLELFLNYGIVDEAMFSEDVIKQLLEAVRRPQEELPVKVYSIREWLHEIYTGGREPSINEFDMDYDKYLREENKSRGPLTQEEAEKQRSTREKTKFEMRNFFVINNRLTNGHMLTFCPIMTEEDLGTNIEGIRIDAKKINDAFNRVREVDFSVFYRMTMYDDRENGIKNMQIHQEVLPEVVLMPNVGSLGRMWQEIGGKRRTTPGRFAFPVFMREDLYKQVVQAIGSFRWEICKREQGTRWNDVTEPSLTSEFCDYLQFYRKNRDLTDKAREKIAQLMTKCRNNYSKIFVYNYICWVDSESAGNVRIDKVSRSILGRYCPFSRDIREKLLQQPLFADSLGRYERERMKKVKELTHYRAAIRNANGQETEQFLQEVDFYEM